MVQNPSGVARILVVGPEGPGRSAIAQIAANRGWECESALSLNQAVRCLRNRSDIDVVFLVPGDTSRLRDAVEICRCVKFDQRTRLVSVVCLLPASKADRRVELYESGADDCLEPDATPREIQLRVEKAVRLKHVTDTLDDADAIVMTLANAVEGKDEYTLGHVDRVSAYAGEIGKRLGLSLHDLAALKLGAVVHDIGKVGIPDPILKKPAKLTDEEQAIMRRHPLIGYEILKPLRTFRQVLPIVRWHHERPNGRGYPDGLKGEQLPLLPRIISVADVFDALSTDRPYRNAMPIDQCVAILNELAHEQSLDATIVRTMLDILALQPTTQGGIPIIAA